MTIKKISELELTGKRVFVRVDFNAPLDKSGSRVEVADDTRIRAALPTIQHCIEQDARIVLASHLGRPKGAVVPELSLEPVARRLAELLDREVIITDEPVGDGARKVTSDLREGQIALLENLRFNPGETKNEDGFARALAGHAEVYINDAFGTAHRAHASTEGMVHHMSEVAAGFVMQSEIDALSRLLGDVDRPYVAVLGGAKVSDKIQVLEALLDRVDCILVGGAMANTFLAASGHNLGSSLVESDRLAVARSFLRSADSKGVTVKLPVDLIVASSLDSAAGKPVKVDEFPEEGMALDIGPESAAGFSDEIARARTLFWNGPMGVFEKRAFSHGTLAVARAIAENRLCYSIAGGGDSVAAIRFAGVTEQISHVSTGGGASLEFVQGLTLPGIAVLDID